MQVTLMTNYYKPREMYEFKSNKLQFIREISVLKSKFYSYYEGRSDKKFRRMLNVPSAFDIETSSFMNNGVKYSNMYIWMFGIYKTIVYGRTWEEYDELLDVLNRVLGIGNGTNMITVWVHNLAYEFAFMRKRYIWDPEQFLAVKNRTPVKATNKGVVYRCTYQLTLKSLEKLAETCKYKTRKMVGYLDYSKLRGSNTPLTEKELKYCSADIEVLLCYIKEQIEIEEKVTDIPLTSTGYVRRHVRDIVLKSSAYKKIIHDIKLTYDEYRLLKQAYTGGFSHGAHCNVGHVKRNGASLDLTSSYPYALVSEKYPMSSAYHVDCTNMTVGDLEKLMERYRVLYTVRFKNLSDKFYYEHYLSVSKAVTISNAVVDNGRVVSCSECVYTLIDTDWQIIKQCYEWDSVEVLTCAYYEQAYLPREFIMCILELYKDKTELKGIEARELEYRLSKARINGIYGMCVTDVLKDTIAISSNGDYDEICNKDEEHVQKYNASEKRFTSYAWGVWCSGIARKNIWLAILENKDDQIYTDTDSVKLTNFDKHKLYYERYNTECVSKLLAMSNERGIDRSYWDCYDIKGNEHILGVFDHEFDFSEFKTLGAKRYMYRINGKYYLTVSGMKKQNCLPYILIEAILQDKSPFDIFDDGLKIPAENALSPQHTFIDIETTCDTVDYMGNEIHVHEYSSMWLGNSDRTLTVTESYLNYLLGEDIENE